MRKSKQEKAETRLRIIEAASSEFLSKGIMGTGLADLMATAGLTHGGFYKHFDSKEQIVEESVTLAIDSLAESIESASAGLSGSRGLRAAMASYLSHTHRDNINGGCPFVSLGSELARSGESVRQASTVGFEKLVNLIAGKLDDMPPAAAKKEALVILSTMIGAVTMARLVNDSRLSSSILREAYKRLCP